jgi:hypothetical protein
VLPGQQGVWLLLLWLFLLFTFSFPFLVSPSGDQASAHQLGCKAAYCCMWKLVILKAWGPSLLAIFQACQQPTAVCACSYKESVTFNFGETQFMFDVKGLEHDIRSNKVHSIQR